MATLDDLAHWWGADLQLAADGDVARVNGPNRSAQRVYRRLLTNPGELKSHPTYGAGIRRFVGAVINVAELTALIRGQMLLEDTVSAAPPPTVSVTPTKSGALVAIGYTALPDKQPVSLSFPVNGLP